MDNLIDEEICIDCQTGFEIDKTKYITNPFTIHFHHCRPENKSVICSFSMTYNNELISTPIQDISINNTFCDSKENVLIFLGYVGSTLLNDLIKEIKIREIMSNKLFVELNDISFSTTEFDINKLNPNEIERLRKIRSIAVNSYAPGMYTEQQNKKDVLIEHLNQIKFLNEMSDNSSS